MDTATAVITVTPPVGTDRIADLRIVDTLDCDNNTFTATLQIRSANTQIFNLGTSSILLNYNQAALQFSGYESYTFDGSDQCIAGVASSWDAHAFDGTSVPGSFNLTMVLNNEGQGCPEVNGTEWVSIGKITYNILDNSLDPAMAYDSLNTNFNVDQPNDGTETVGKNRLIGVSGADVLSCDSANIPPIALFTATPTAGAPPLLVSFNASASSDPDGTIFSYAWNFGDGSPTADGVVVTHTYTVAGTYTAQLIVTDDSAASDTFTVAINVNAGNVAPVANFTATPTEGAPPLLVSFDASTSTDVDGQIVSYDWDFGDGTQATGVTATHTYTVAGTYTAQLIVTDDSTASDTFTVAINVNAGNVAPVANFTATPTAGAPPLLVSFDASASTDSDGQIVSYAWDFGDGTTGTGVTAAHTYNAVGTFTAQLIVTDDSAASDTFTVAINVNANQPPTAVFTATPITGNAPLLVNVDANASTDADGTILAYAWDFGDGTLATGVTANHTYALAGNYTVQLIITDDGGALDTATAVITVTPPVGTDRIADLRIVDTLDCDNNTFTATLQIRSSNTQVFNLGTSSILVNYNQAALQYSGYESYTFDGSDQCIAGVASSWDVHAIDGTSVPGSFNLTMVLNNEGQGCPEVNGTEWISIGKITYNILDNSLDPAIAYDSLNTNFNVDQPNDGTETVGKNQLIGVSGADVLSCDSANIPPIALFIADPLAGAPPLLVNFNASASNDPDGQIVSYAWDFGDGTQGTGVVAAHTYTVAGTYTARLIVTDDSAASDTFTVAINVNGGNIAPEATFTATPPTGNAPLSVFLDATGSNDPDGNIVSYEWDFGDGTIGTGDTTTHIFADAGTYNVRLIVTDDSAASDTFIVAILVNPGVGNQAPTATFTATPPTGNAPLSVFLDATASTDPDGQIVSYVWDFGDGTTGTGDTTTHIFTNAGTYNVQLIVTDDSAASDTFLVTIIVNPGVGNQAPVATFTATPTVGAPPLLVSFDATASNDPDGQIVSYIWDFGDGTTGTGVTAAHTYNAVGTYTAQLIVTDDSAASDTFTVAINVNANQPPTAVFTATPTTGAAPLLVNVDASASTDPDGNILAYDWDFGDGTVGTGPTSNHTYLLAGIYTIQLIITDDGGARDTATTVITVTPPVGTDRIADLRMVDTLDCDNNTFTATLQIRSSNTQVFNLGTSSILVNYNDAAIQYDSYESYTFDGSDQCIAGVASSWDAHAIDGNSVPGVFNLTMILNNEGQGCPEVNGTDWVSIGKITFSILDNNLDPAVAYDSSNTNFNVDEPNDGTQVVGKGNLLGLSGTLLSCDSTNIPPIALFIADPLAGAPPLLVNFNASASNDPDGQIVSYAWDFGDGTQGTGVVAAHTYTVAGTYTAQLIVTDDSAASDTFTIAINVNGGNIAPEATFTATPPTGNAPLSVFLDATGSNDPDGNIVSYEWDFGDGTIGTGDTTSHIFANAGTYNVRLIVTDDSAASDTFFVAIVVNPGVGNQAPTATFTATPPTGNAPLSVFLDATGSNDPDGNIVSYEWDFGDGTIGTGDTTSHLFANAGTYNVRLIVTDDSAASDTFFVAIVVNPGVGNQAPTATFTATPPTGNAPLSVFLDATGSNDPDGNIVSYEWDFGDGTIGTGDTTSHIFANAGTYNVRLIVTDDSAASDTFFVAIVVNPGAGNQAPTATFTATPPTGNAPLSVFFDATGSSDPDGQILSYAWDFGDGALGTGDTTSHIFANAGTYNVRLIVTDDSAASDTFIVAILVNPGVGNQAPTATFTATPPTGNAPLSVFLDATASTDPDGQIVSYVWDFGDGTTGTGDTTTHIFTNAGTYNVQLIVTDDSAASDTFLVTIIVNPGVGNQAPVATFTATPTVGAPPLLVSFDATASNDPDGQIVSYAWDFGDGTTGTGVTAAHTYNAVGTYTAQLIVTDDSAASDTFTVAINVNANQPPTAVFSATPTTGAAPLLVNVDASASTDSDGNILAYDWDFGDGTVGTGPTSNHTYLLAGIYTIQLIITDDGGARDTATTVITVTPPVGTDRIADLRMVDTLDCDNNTFTATLQIRSSNTQVFNLGTSSILVNYNDAAIQYDSYESYTFDGSDQCIAGVASSWDAHAIDGNSVPGVFNLTMILNNEGQGCPEVEGTDWVSIGKITFSILDNNLDPAVAYDSSNTNFNVDEPNDGTQVVGKGNLLGLSGTLLSCDSTNIPPIALFIADPLAGAPPLLVNFNASASNDPDGQIVSYAWDFGDGTQGTGVVAAHTYTVAGTYTAQLIVTDDSAASDTFTVAINVNGGNIAPEATFTATPPTGNAPLSVFLDATGSNDPDGNIVSYEWDFGDGTIGTGDTTTHIFADAGTYNVRLIVTDDSAASDTFIVAILVNPGVGNQAPTATFTATPPTGNAPLSVFLDATGSNDPDGNIVSYEWDFGDGTIGTGDTTTHIFADAGTYNVRLIVTDDSAASDTFFVAIVVNPGVGNQAPTATFTATPPTGNAPLSVFLDATGSNDPDGNIVSYEWDFGDGTIGIGDTTTHIFANAGTYNVRLIVTDDSAASDTFFVAIVVNPGAGNQAPTATFTATPPTGNAPLSVFFDATGSSDPDGQILSYAWDFGDGALGTGDTTSHIFANAGTYNVRLIVTDDSLASDTFFVSVVVGAGDNLTPIASFVANPITGVAPLLVSVDASTSTDLDGSILAYNWDFGDGTTGMGVNATHTYQLAGIYTIRLIVIDDGGARDTAEATISVTPPVGTERIADMRMVDTLDCENNVFTATLQIRSANTQIFNLGTSSILVNYNDSALAFTAYESYAFDGSDQCIAGVASAWDAQAFDGGSVPGIFNLTMILNNEGEGCPEINGTDWVSIGRITFSILDNTLDPAVSYDSLNTNFNVDEPNDGSVTVAKGKLFGLSGNVLSCDTANIPPVALFMADPLAGAPPLLVSFDANASNDVDGTIVSYEWDFGDGATGTGLVITHTYNDEGSYEARLIVTDDQGAKDTMTVGLLVSNGNLPPIAVIMADTLMGNAPFDVAFDGSNSTDVDGTIESYIWDFGDGILGEGSTPTHIFLNEGTYTVSLIVTDDMGARDTASIDITVLPPLENQAPIASFVADPITGNAPLSVNFDATLSSDPDGQIISYRWNFGDGNTGEGDTTNHVFTQPGEYTVRLIVTDNGGAMDTAETVITVIDVSSGPVADLRFVTVQDCETDSLTATIQIKARTGQNFNLGTSSILVTYDQEVLDYASYSSLRFDGSDTCIEGLASSWEPHAVDGISVPGLFNLTLVLNSEGFGCPEVDSSEWVDIGIVRFAIANPALNPQLSFDRDNTNFNVHEPNDGTVVVGKGEFNPADITPCESNIPPEAIIVAIPDSGNVPLEVSFIGANSQDIDGQIVTYIWDFGDGTTDTASNTVHTYTEVGEYTATLIVIDNSGAADTAGVLIQVVNPSTDPIASLRMEGGVDCETNTLSVSVQIKAETATSFNLGDSRISLEYNTVAMDLIGYTSANFNENTVCGEDERNPWLAHEVNEAEILGQVGIQLTLNDPGASCPIIDNNEWITIGTLEFQIVDTSMMGELRFDSLVTRFNVSSPNDGSVQIGLGTLTGLSGVDLNCLDDLFPPIAVITTDTTIGFAPLTINFSGSESTDPDSNIVSYFWDFGVGDSTVIDAMDTSFTFTEPGNYTVTLIVVDADGLRDTAQVLIQVGDGDNFPPVILCNVSPDSGITPINVLFDATQSFDPDGDELTFTWEFGDGLTGEGPLVNHVYTTHGEIVVKLTVEDGRGGVSVQEKTLTLFPPSFENPGDTLSVEGLSLQWDVFPNPLEDFAVVRLRDIGDVDQLDIEIYDHAGRLVFLETVIKLDEILDYRIDLGSMSSGIYVIAIRTDNSLSSRHIIVK